MPGSRNPRHDASEQDNPDRGVNSPAEPHGSADLEPRTVLPLPRDRPDSLAPAEPQVFSGDRATSQRPDPKPGFEAVRSVSEVREEIERNTPPPERPTLQSVIRSPRRWWRRWVTTTFPGTPDYLVEALAVVVVLLLLAAPVAVVLMIRGAVRDEPDLGIRAEPVQPDPRHLTSDDESGAVEAIRAYLAADGWKAKLAFVRHPFDAEPRMARWYADPRSSGRDGSRELGDVLLRKKEDVEGRNVVVLAVEVLPEAEHRIFLVERVNDTLFKIDWESSEGYQEMRLDDFKAGLPTEPTTFRVHARRSDYFNFGFSADGYECFQLSYPNDPEFSLFAYAPKDSEVAGQLARHLPPESPVSASLIVDLAYPAEDARPEQALIVGLRQASWLED